MPRKQKEQTPKKKRKEKSPKKSEDPKMDEAELNRLAARAEQNLEDRITALHYSQTVKYLAISSSSSMSVFLTYFLLVGKKGGMVFMFDF